MPALTIYTTEGPIRQVNFDDLAAARKLQADLETVGAESVRYSADDGVEVTIYIRHITQMVLDPTYKPLKGTNR